MRRILWNIDAMGWFEPVDHLLQYGKMLQWSGKIVIRPNLENAIDAFLDASFEVYVVSSKSEDYLQECVKAAGIELKVQLAANLPEKNLMTDYSSLMDPMGCESLVIGSRPSHQPMKSKIVFLYDYKSFKKDAMVDFKTVKKLGMEGHGSLILGYNHIFSDNNKDPIFVGEEIFLEEIDFYGSKLEMGLRKHGCHTIHTIIIDENVAAK